MLTKEVTLPIGIEKDGTRYKKVIISEMNGYDEENLTSKKVRNNGAKAQTILLQRCIQEIPGLLDRKERSNDLISSSLVRSMYSFDRDFLFISIRSLGVNLSSEEEPTEFRYGCPSCGAEGHSSVLLSDLPVYDWPDDEPLEMEIEFLRPFNYLGEEYTTGTWRFMNGRQQEGLAAQPQEKVASETLAMCIVKLGDTEVTITGEMMKRLTSNERNHILSQVVEETPGIDTKLDCVCDSCEAEWQEILDISRFFDQAAKRKKSESPQPKKRRRKLRKV